MATRSDRCRVASLWQFFLAHQSSLSMSTRETAREQGGRAEKSSAIGRTSSSASTRTCARQCQCATHQHQARPPASHGLRSRDAPASQCQCTGRQTVAHAPPHERINTSRSAAFLARSAGPRRHGMIEFKPSHPSPRFGMEDDDRAHAAGTASQSAGWCPVSPLLARLFRHKR